MEKVRHFSYFKFKATIYIQIDGTINPSRNVICKTIYVYMCVCVRERERERKRLEISTPNCTKFVQSQDLPIKSEIIKRQKNK